MRIVDNFPYLKSVGFPVLLFTLYISAAPTVSDFLHISVPGGGPLTDLFTFPMPAPCDPAPCTERRVMMAKFVVNEPDSHLNFELRSTTTSLDTYSVVGFSTAGGGPNISVMDNNLGPTVEAATVRARFTEEATAPGYRMLTILVRFNNEYDNFPSGESWKIQAYATPTTDHYYGFRVDSVLESSAEALITKPYLIQYITEAQIPTGPYTTLGSTYSINFGEVHINLADEFIPREPWEFRNMGTAPLEIQTVTPFPLPSGPFIIENYPSPPMSVLPMNAFQRTVKCKPISLGAIANPGISLTTNAGSYNLNLSGAKGIELRSALVIDLSGSMEMDKNGTHPVAKEEQRIYSARIAALELAELYNTILPKGKMGLYSYPATINNYTCPSSEQFINMSIMETNIQAYRNRLNTNLGHPDLIDAGSIYSAFTPLAEGIARAWNVLHPKPENSRAAVFLFGDGDHNCNSTGSRETPSDWYNWSTFRNAGIPFITIPYGNLTSGWMETFSAISEQTNGDFFPANITDDSELQTQFKKALGKVLDLETLKDPASRINAGQDTTFEICVSSSAYQLIFSVHWTQRNANAVNVTIETPYHTLLTPTTVPGHGGHASYIPGVTYKNYIVRGKFLSADSGVGAWKIHVHGNATTDFVYQVYAMDRMKSEWNLTLDYIGVNGMLDLAFSSGNYTNAAANVSATISRPTASYQNWLAKSTVTPEQIARIPDSLARIWGVAEKKHYILATLQKNTFNPRIETETQHLGELDNEVLQDFTSYKRSFIRPDQRSARSSLRARNTGLASRLAQIASGSEPIQKKSTYRLPLKAAVADGLHKIDIRVIGVNSKAECFEREYTLSTIVSVKLNSDLLTRAVLWEDAASKPFFPPEVVKVINTPVPEGKVRKVVTFTPRDSMGNMFGVGRGDEISMTYTNTDTIGPLIDNYDGSYSRLVEFSQGANPQVVAAIGDSRSEPVPYTRGRTIPLWVLIVLLIAILVVIILRILKK